MKIAVGTTSELKIKAVRSALKKLGIEAEIIPYKSNSGVSNQPFGYSEIVSGARNRANSALIETKANWAIGIENGLVQISGTKQWYDIPGVVVLTNDGKESIGFGPAHEVPDWMVEEIKTTGVELGTIIQRFNHNGPKDPVEYFSAGQLKREEFIAEAVASSLFKIVNPDKFREEEPLEPINTEIKK